MRHSVDINNEYAVVIKVTLTYIFIILSCLCDQRNIVKISVKHFISKS